MKQIQGKRQLVPVIGEFEKPRVQEIRILLYIIMLNNTFFFSPLVMQAVKTYAKMLIGRTTEEIFNNFAAVWRELARESQFRWVC